MQNDPKVAEGEDALRSPQPPEKVKTDNADAVTEKVQDHDWNNGRMEVTPEYTDKLNSHTAAENKEEKKTGTAE